MNCILGNDIQYPRVLFGRIAIGIQSDWHVVKQVFGLVQGGRDEIPERQEAGDGHGWGTDGVNVSCKMALSAHSR